MLFVAGGCLSSVQFSLSFVCSVVVRFVQNKHELYEALFSDKMVEKIIRKMKIKPRN